MSLFDAAVAALLGREYGADADSVARDAGQAFESLGALAGSQLAVASGRPTVTTPAQATITAILAAKVIRVSQQGSANGVFRGAVGFRVAGVAADVVTCTVQVITDAVAGVPLTLTAATAAGQNCFTDDGTGAGIGVTGGGAAATIAAPAQTLGTAAAGLWFQWSGLISLATPVGGTCLLLVSVTDSAAARAISEASISLQEVIQ